MVDYQLIEVKLKTICDLTGLKSSELDQMMVNSLMKLPQDKLTTDYANQVCDRILSKLLKI